MKIAFLTTDNREHFRQYQQKWPAFGTAPTALLEGFAGLAELELHVVSCTQRPMTSPLKLAQNIWFHSLTVPKWGWLRTAYSGCILAIRKKLKLIQPDLVHAQGTERDCAISAAFLRYPRILTIHGNIRSITQLNRYRWFSYWWLQARLEDLSVPQFDGVLCNSRYTQSLISAINPKTWLVPNPVGLGFLNCPKQGPLKTDEPIILVVGVISPRKRQLELLGMFLSLRKSGLKFQVRWIGRCPADFYGKRFLSTSQSDAFIGWNQLVGEISQASLIQEMDSGESLVHFPCEEAFGLVVAEALARGLKVFSSGVGGLPEICSGQTDAEIISPEDWTGLAQAIAHWARSGYPSSRQGPVIMRQRYHPSVIASRHLEIYREVMAIR